MLHIFYITRVYRIPIVEVTEELPVYEKFFSDLITANENSTLILLSTKKTNRTNERINYGYRKCVEMSRLWQSAFYALFPILHSTVCNFHYRILSMQVAYLLYFITSEWRWNRKMVVEWEKNLDYCFLR